MTIGNQEVKFGRRQRHHPTPKRIEFICDLAVKIFSGVAGVLTITTLVDNEVSNLFSAIVNLILVQVLLEIKKYFGVQVPERRVPVDKVEVIDDSKPNDK
jgi:hypothetical protein